MKHYRLKIERDHAPQNPREDDNFGTMWCWHKRGDYGDEKPRGVEYSRDAYIRLLGDVGVDLGEDEDADLEVVQALFSDHYIWLPIYMYDHSGVALSTKPFACRWDSGQLGLIFISKKKAWREMHFTGDGWSPAQVELCLANLRGEVETYGHWISGDVYNYTVEYFEYEFEIPGGDDAPEIDPEDDDLDWQEVDGCGGFPGDDPTENGLADDFGTNQHPALQEAQRNLGRWVALPPRVLR